MKTMTSMSSENKIEIYVDRYYTLIDSGFSKTSAINKVCFEFGLSSYDEDLLICEITDYKEDLEDALREQQYFKEMYYNEKAKIQSWDEKMQQIKNLMGDKNET